MQPNEAARAIPQSATRARAAINPRAFSGGALRNQSFANLAAARDPGARMLAGSTSKVASLIRSGGGVSAIRS